MKRKGFTLIEIVVATSLSMLTLLVIYLAFYISQSFTQKGINIVNDEMDFSILFERLKNRMKFLNRINYISPEMDEISFEIFDVESVEIDPLSHDRVVKGLEVHIRPRVIKGGEILELEEKIEEYKWIAYFKHSQVPGDDGYPQDLVETRETLSEGDPHFKKEFKGRFEPLIEQEEGNELMITDVKFIPLDSSGKEILGGGGYEMFKKAVGIKIKFQYYERVFGLGEASELKPKLREVSTIVNLVNLSLVKIK